MPSHNKEIFVRKTLYVPFNVTCENQSQHLSHTYSPSTLLLPHPDATPLQGDFVWNCLYVPVDVAHGTCTWHMRIDRNASLTHFFFYQLLPQMRIYQNMQADRDFLSSGENESCRMWMSHVACEWVMSYMNESSSMSICEFKICQIEWDMSRRRSWHSLFRWKWVIFHVNESCLIVFISRMNESCLMVKICHVTHEWFISHMNESCHIWMSLSHMNTSCHK